MSITYDIYWGGYIFANSYILRGHKVDRTEVYVNIIMYMGHIFANSGDTEVGSM